MWMIAMNKKGQIFSLDFLFSVAVMILVIGFLLMFVDLQSQSQKDEITWLELKSVGERASALLVSSPDIECTLVDSSGGELMKLSNCVDTSKITKDNLGIPSDYGYRLEIGSSHWGQIIPEAAHNIYSTQRFVITSNGDLRKNNIPSSHELAKLSIWRNPA